MERYHDTYQKQDQIILPIYYFPARIIHLGLVCDGSMHPRFVLYTYICPGGLTASALLSQSGCLLTVRQEEEQ